jgi:CubicO group peptidase (beta-lactamase class C family)
MKGIEMKPSILLVISFIIIKIIAATFIISPPVANASESIQSKADEYMIACQDMNLFSGSVLISKGGKVLLQKGYGMADREQKIENSAKTKFRICSLTKSFTAMAIMQLEEKGKLSVNDKLSKFIPDYPNGDKITIHHLLTNTSGIVDHTELPDFKTIRRTKPVTIEQTIATFKKRPLKFMPGEKFEYSNSNYILLGLISEKVSGKSYGDFIRGNIFVPLKMNNSGFEYYNKLIENFATGYKKSDITIIKADSRVMSNAHASGGLYSTIEDLYLWDRALYTDKLVGKETLNKMFTPFKDVYGYGWCIIDIFDKKVTTHGGDIEGYNTNITRFIDDDVCIIILSNFEHALTGKISMDLAAITFGKEYKLPQKQATGDNIYKNYNDYIGEYQLNPNVIFGITRKGNMLFFQQNDRDKLEILPESETEFFIREADIKVTFVRDSKKRVIQLILHLGDRDLPAQKISK